MLEGFTTATPHQQQQQQQAQQKQQNMNVDIILCTGIYYMYIRTRKGACTLLKAVFVCVVKYYVCGNN